MKALGWKENRQQNDVLMALTAKYSNTAIITYDRHFERVRELLDFQMVLLKERL